MPKAQLRLEPRAAAKAHVLDLLTLLLMLSLPRLSASVPLTHRALLPLLFFLHGFIFGFTGVSIGEVTPCVGHSIRC